MSAPRLRYPHWLPLTVLLLVACAAPQPPGPTAPMVHLMLIELADEAPGEGPDGTGPAVWLELRLLNLNEVALSTRGYQFELELDGRRFAAGVVEESIRLERFGQALTRVRVIALQPEIAKKLGIPGSVDDFDYRIRGEFFTEGPGSRALPFEQTGRLLGSGTSY